mmetsp:Transcript_29505/g.44685  ORF Transcript_29505/g.44685 Transcript_29505/m.44685 type:complete len:100 (+) Transcript_29505:585-884(+)
MPWSVGDNTSNLVCLNWDFHFSRPQSKVGSHEDKRSRNANPQSKESQNGQKGDGSGSSCETKENIQNNEYGDQEAWESKCGIEAVELPCLSIEELVETS